MDAAAAHGTPVIVITGNGHARSDWGISSYIARVTPDMTTFSLWQGPGAPDSDAFDETISTAPPPDRDDPCAAFQSN